MQSSIHALYTLTRLIYWLWLSLNFPPVTVMKQLYLLILIGLYFFLFFYRSTTAHMIGSNNQTYTRHFFQIILSEYIQYFRS